MTKAQYEIRDDEFIFTCRGHAGYADAGSDIVCAGISTLTQTLVSYLPEVTDTFSARISAGDVFINAKGRDALICFQMMMEGLRLIQSSFPEYLETTEGCTINS